MSHNPLYGPRSPRTAPTRRGPCHIDDLSTNIEQTGSAEIRPNSNARQELTDVDRGAGQERPVPIRDPGACRFAGVLLLVVLALAPPAAAQVALGGVIALRHRRRRLPRGLRGSCAVDVCEAARRAVIRVRELRTPRVCGDTGRPSRRRSCAGRRCGSPSQPGNQYGDCRPAADLEPSSPPDRGRRGNASDGDSACWPRWTSSKTFTLLARTGLFVGW